MTLDKSGPGSVGGGRGYCQSCAGGAVSLLLHLSLGPMSRVVNLYHACANISLKASSS